MREAPNQPDTVPLCVDLDGTLLRTDTLHEAVMVLVRTNLLLLFMLPVWLMKGRAYMKAQIMSRVTLDPEHLPVNIELMKFLRTEHALGRKLVLATACNQTLARKIAHFFAIFDEVIASDEHDNLAGERKAKRLVERFGEKGFDYAGNEHRDLKVWKHARHAIGAQLAPGAADGWGIKLFREFDPLKLNAKTVLRAIRVHQWAKNLLLFAPLVLAHRMGDRAAIFYSIGAFFAFSFQASAFYLVNDLFDLEADRKHGHKKHRPLASGQLPIATAVLLFGLLLAVAYSVAAFLPNAFIVALFIYGLCSLSYTFSFKRRMLVDVIMLSSLYTGRIIAGGVATQITVSPWLLAFSTFLFLGLALVKRYSDLLFLRRQGKTSSDRRAYHTDDAELIGSMGIASSYVSVLVLALWINSPTISNLYTTPEILWILCLLVLYWCSRIWILAHRGILREDPVLFAIRDKATYYLAGIATFILAMASR